MRIYLAGKMDAEHGAWRDALLESQGDDWPDRRRAPYWEIVRDSADGNLNFGDIGVPPWPTKPNRRVLGLHDYVGPYRTTYEPEIDSKYTGYFHGSTVTGQHGQTNFEDHAAIIRECRSAIERTDLVFAYVNRPDCFGTLAEIGMARAAGAYVVGAFEPDAEWDGGDYWFSEALCDVTVRVPQPIVVGVAPDAPERAAGAMYGIGASSEWRAYHENMSAWCRRRDQERARMQGLIKDAIVQWSGRSEKPASLSLDKQNDSERFLTALRESAQSFSQIARWSADPRVRDEAQRMLRRITG